MQPNDRRKRLTAFIKNKKMNYCSSIVVDFGSTNSGCARIELEESNSGYRTPTFIQGNQAYAKDATWFFVHPNFWQQICGNYDQISDSDFRIRSRALPYTKNPNVIWGRQHMAESTSECNITKYF